MSWIDIAILATVVICGLFGVLRGVKKSALTLGAFIVAFLLAFFLANVVAEAFLGIDGIKSFVLGDGVYDKGWSLAKWLYDSIPEGYTTDKFLFKNFYQPMDEAVKGANLGDLGKAPFAMYGAFVIFSAICGVGIFFIARFLLMIVVAVINTYISKKKSVTSRLFGFVIGAVRGALWAFAATVVFTCFGGYTFAPAVSSVGKEFGNNAVVCQYFYEGAYGLRNSLFLPDSDTAGRLVKMIYGNGEDIKGEEEKLTGDRLDLFIKLSNLNYDNSPWSVDENHKRKFDADNAVLRKESEFAIVDFDNVIKAIIDYNTAAAEIVDDPSKLSEIDSKQFQDYSLFVNGGAQSVDTFMNTLWQQLRAYKQHYLHPVDVTLSAQNSTLKSDYDRIVKTLDDLKEKYSSMSDALGEFPELTVPEQKVLTEDGPPPDPDGGIDVPVNPGGGETPDPENPGGGGETPEPENPGGGGETPDPENPGGGGETPDPENPGGGTGEDPDDPENQGTVTNPTEPTEPETPDPETETV